MNRLACDPSLQGSVDRRNGVRTDPTIGIDNGVGARRVGKMLDQKPRIQRRVIDPRSGETRAGRSVDRRQRRRAIFG
jgi:hypothetical protein